LSTQESRCREYERDKGYEVLKIFNDNTSGGGTDRAIMGPLMEPREDFKHGQA
jgi:hypothetical protein